MFDVAWRSHLILNSLLLPPSPNGRVGSGLRGLDSQVFVKAGDEKSNFLWIAACVAPLCTSWHRPTWRCWGTYLYLLIPYNGRSDTFSARVRRERVFLNWDFRKRKFRIPASCNHYWYPTRYTIDPNSIIKKTPVESVQYNATAKLCALKINWSSSKNDSG